MPSEKLSHFTVVFHPAPEGGYDVFVPALPGCVTQGDTLVEARRMAEDAIRLYCESLIADGERIPEDHKDIVDRLAITIQPA